MYEVDSNSSDDRGAWRSESSRGAAGSDSDDLLSGFDNKSLKRIKKLKKRSKSVTNTNGIDVKQYLE